jgi:glycine C-acetyltransferase
MDGVVRLWIRYVILADKYDALVMIDECHATGFIGATGKGTLEAKE